MQPCVPNGVQDVSKKQRTLGNIPIHLFISPLLDEFNETCHPVLLISISQRISIPPGKQRDLFISPRQKLHNCQSRVALPRTWLRRLGSEGRCKISLARSPELCSTRHHDGDHECLYSVEEPLKASSSSQRNRFVEAVNYQHRAHV